jgi:hypothetical protein
VKGVEKFTKGFWLLFLWSLYLQSDCWDEMMSVSLDLIPLLFPHFLSVCSKNQAISRYRYVIFTAIFWQLQLVIELLLNAAKAEVSSGR